MRITNLTWLGFFMTLSSLTITPKILAVDEQNVDTIKHITENIETRLNRISEALKAREKDLPENAQNYPDNEILLGGFINGGGGWRNGGGGWRNGGGGWRNGGGAWRNGGGGSFLNRSGPGGFLNNIGGGGFFNRGWRDGGGFFNRGWW